MARLSQFGSLHCLFLLLILSPSVWGIVSLGQSAAADIDDVIRRAEAARDSGRLPEAAELYKKSLEARPYWVEGWWYLSTILYDLDRYSEATEAFRRFVALEPNSGPGWALLGLNEYQMREYDRSLSSLQKALALGLGGHGQLNYVTRFHAALLLTRIGEFEAAIAILHEISLRHSENPQVMEALGLSVLRMPFLPVEVPADRREAVMMAGRAASYWSTNRLEDAAHQYYQLRDRYGDMPNVHYALGVFSLQYDPPSALGEFLKELEYSPKHVAARLQLAFEYIKRGEAGKGLSYAEDAVRIAPGSFAARNALGRTLLELGEVDRAIAELEKGVELEPESPQMHFALARAYTKAGRREEARKAREEFLRLDAIVRRREEERTPLIPSMGEGQIQEEGGE